jgi:hypothetical protein
MKRLVLAVVLAFAVLGGAIAMSVASSPQAIAGCVNDNC